MKPRCISIAMFFPLLMLFACKNDGCGDLGGITYSNITSLTGSIVSFEDNSYSSYDTLEDKAEVPFYSFGLRLSPVAEYYSLRKEAPKGSWLSAAYACSPLPPQPTEDIADIAVFSNADYTQGSSSKVIAAGDTLNSIFEIYDYASGRIVGLPDFLIDEQMKASYQGFALRLSVAVAAIQQHQFIVHYHLTNGEFYTYQASAVTLIP